MKLKLLMLSLLFIVLSCNSDSSKEEANVELVKKYYNAVNNKDTSSVNNLVSANFTKINNDKVADKKGPTLLSDSIKDHIANNKEYQFIIDDIYSKKNKVTVRWRWESINIKYGNEKRVTSQGISVFEINNEKINVLWQAFDLLGFNKQLGIN